MLEKPTMDGIYSENKLQVVSDPHNKTAYVYTHSMHKRFYFFDIQQHLKSKNNNIKL